MRLTRRTALKTLAGSVLLGPFLREAWARAQTEPPARLVLVLECNGIYPEAFLSTAARAALDALGNGSVGNRHNFSNVYPSSTRLLTGDALSTALCLGPLAASGTDISLEDRAAVVLGLSSVISGGGHSSGTGALSCAVNGSAPTLDAVLAPRLKRGAPFDAIRLGTSSAHVPIVYETCSFGPRKPAPILVNPALAYDSVFGSLSGSTGTGAERSELFDFAREDVQATLAEFRGNSNERAKLERYLASLEALRARETQLGEMADTVRPLLPLAPDVNPLLVDTGGRPDSLLWLEAQFEIATTSLLGGLTNNVVLASGSSGFDVGYESIIAGVGRHDLQHGIDNGGNWDAIAAVTRQHVALIAKLARTLAATPEVGASGTMLDHTAIVFMSDNGEQHHSTGTEWPMLLLGGDALGLQTNGRSVIYPAEGAANNRQVSNLFNSLGHAVGDTSLNEFGSEGPTRIAAGPLDEILG